MTSRCLTVGQAGGPGGLRTASASTAPHRRCPAVHSCPCNHLPNPPRQTTFPPRAENIIRIKSQIGRRDPTRVGSPLFPIRLISPGSTTTAFPSFFIPSPWPSHLPFHPVPTAPPPSPSFLCGRGRAPRLLEMSRGAALVRSW